MELDIKKEAKETISQLIQRYEKLTTTEKKNYNEANTRKNFILPMFEALGWDIREDIVEEDPAISGRVDYSFRLNHITQFLLEAKSISENLDKDQWAKQTVEYGWNRGVPWVVLSDFEGLKLFNSELNTSHPKPIFDFKYTDYLENFDKLWLLSKESLEQNLLDTTLTGFGIGSKRVRINDVLAADLVKWRDQLTSNFKSWNSRIDGALLNESVQRILDRLIFIRVVEDKGIEDKFLWQAFQKWQANGFKPYNFLEILIPLFRKFDQAYNSNLFLVHFCEKLDTEGDPFKTIIPDLYVNKQQQVSYRFDAVNADVLGKVYEQYLGYLQKGKEDKGKRKQQGIYYTPSYIVDYIVRNTIGKKLEEYGNYAEKQSIKILDPACGSGSFLINSFDYLDNYFRKLNNENITDHNIAAIRKYRILSENIYGVDLDEQAIEIAKLNLLLQAVVPNFKLPLLNKHLHVGNSLIEDKGVTDKAFDWKKEFTDVFERDNPGFDVIIGNPPYIGQKGNSEVFKLLQGGKWKGFYERKQDLYYYFIALSVELLRKGGYLGMITPQYWMTAYAAKNLRKLISKQCSLVSVLDLSGKKVFDDASINSSVFIFKKNKSINRIQIEELPGKNQRKTYFSYVTNPELSEESWNIFKTKSYFDLSSHCNNCLLGNISKIVPGIQTGIDKSEGNGVFVLNDKEYVRMDFPEEYENFVKPLFKNSQISRFHVPDKNKFWIIITNNIEQIDQYPKLKRHLTQYKSELDKRYKNFALRKAYAQNKWWSLYGYRPKTNFDAQKIVFPYRSEVPKFAISNSPFYSCMDIYYITELKREYSYEFLCGLLNSKLLRYYFETNCKKKGSIIEFSMDPLSRVPIPINHNKFSSPLRSLVGNITKSMISLSGIPINSDEYRKIEGQIKEVDDKIDRLVYQIYWLNQDEVNEIEGTLNKVS